MSSPLVSVGIVTWNSANHLPSCLDSLAGQEFHDWELVVVDNASNDNSLDTIIRNYPSVKLINNTINMGYCRAHNQAIQASSGPFYLALNPDVTLHKGYMSKLVSKLEEKPGYGMAAGKLLQSRFNGQVPVIDSTGLFINRQRRQYLRGYGELDVGQYDCEGEVFGVDGAAPLYRREMLEDIKIQQQYFDESFFAHKEDVDLAWRARLLGWRCWYSPEAMAIHPRTFRPGQKREVISPSIRVHAVKNRYLLLKKNESSLGWRRDGFRILWYDLKILVYLLLFERSSLKAFRLLKEVWPQADAWRQEIWKRVRANPAEMLEWFQ